MTININDTVTVPGAAKFPGVWTVVKINRTTADLTQDGRRLRAPISMLVGADASATATVTAVPIPEIFDAGEFVRIPDGRFAGLWIVIRDSGKGRVTLAPPGGGRGIYGVKRNLVRVDVSEVLK